MIAIVQKSEKSLVKAALLVLACVSLHTTAVCATGRCSIICVMIEPETYFIIVRNILPSNNSDDAAMA